MLAALFFAVGCLGCSWTMRERHPERAPTECSSAAPALDVAGAVAFGGTSVALFAAALTTNCQGNGFGSVGCPEGRTGAFAASALLAATAALYGLSAASGFADLDACRRSRPSSTQR